MLKKIIIILFLLIPILSCGKKSDPVYQEKSGLIKMKVYGTTDIVNISLFKFRKSRCSTVIINY